MRRSWHRVRVDGPGIAVATTTWGPAPGPRVLAAHATGMCKEVLHPTVAALAAITERGEVDAFDQRCHGDSGMTPPPYTWWDLARDALAVLGGRDGVVGLGHSSGGAALVMAELLAPGSFRALVLVEPVIPPGDENGEDHPLVAAARKRKARFAGVDEARESYAARPAFAGWVPEALDAYVRHGLAPGPDGVELKCPPEAEAELYRAAFEHRAWDRLGEVACPVVLVGGGRSQSHARTFLERLARRFPAAGPAEIVPEASHFVAMEQPEAVAAILARRLDVAG